MAKVTFSMETNKVGSKVYDTYDLEKVVPDCDNISKAELEEKINNALADWIENRLTASWKISF